MIILDSIEGLDQETFLSKIIPSWVSLVTQLAAFLVLIVVIIIFAYKPVKKIIETRKNHIEENIKNAESNSLIAEKNAKESEQMIIDSRRQANEIIEQAKLTAKSEQNKIIDETTLLVSKMKADAQEEIERSKVEAKEEIRKEIISVALDASKEILKREVNEEDDSRLADEFIRSMK